MNGFWLATLSLASIVLAGCNCPMCEKKSESQPVVQKNPVAEAKVAAPHAAAPNAAATQRIVGLDEGWELAPAGATYTASQTPGEVIVKANGEHPTGGYETKLVMSALRIYPPQWMLAQKKPARPAAQVITPFEVTASFKANDKIAEIQVGDAGGKHTVVVDQARD